MIRTLKRGCLAAVTGLVLLGATVTHLGAQAPSVDLTFGVYTTDKPTAMYRKFTPLIQAVEESMQETLGTSVAIEVRIYKSYSTAREALVQGKVDFVRFGPASYVLAKRENPAINLLAMESKKGKKLFKGYIVVHTQSDVKALKDLAGKRFAFGDENSTIGRYLSQQALFNAGVAAKDLGKYEFLGRHDIVFRSVQLKDFEAGALKQSTFDKLNAKSKQNNRLRILASFDNVTKPWVAREGLEKATQTALQRALLDMRDEVALASLKADRLVSAEDQDYDVIRKSMEASSRFLPKAKPGR
jgi:phosphonate transport system substrate-binding protein